MHFEPYFVANPPENQRNKVFFHQPMPVTFRLPSQSMIPKIFMAPLKNIHFFAFYCIFVKQFFAKKWQNIKENIFYFFKYFSGV